MRKGLGNRGTKRQFSKLTLEAAMQLIPVSRFRPWTLPARSRPPSDILLAHLDRLRVFDLESTEEAKTLLMDAVLAEIVVGHPHLKIWKAMPLAADVVAGVADYLIAPDYAYLTTPLLCVAEAKRDDFVQGRAQCVAEMAACRWTNRQRGHDIDIYGIVSNGQAWQFYELTQAGAINETALFVTSDLPRLLGAVDYVCAQCARNLPVATQREER